jgi:DegV family protein with EDD domain
MHETQLITDSGCDLSLAVLQDAGVELLYFPYSLDGEQRLDDFGRSLSYDAFYDRLRMGATSTTSQARPIDCEAAFERAHRDDKTALLVTISSGLSASYDTSMTVREKFLRENPGARVYVVDSLSVSAGQGLLVLEMARRLAAGMSAEDVVTWALFNRHRVNHLVTVDSLDYLIRGGRLSQVAGTAGKILDVKPILHIDAKGRLALLKRCRGRKRTLAAVADIVASRIETPRRQTIVIDHADCPEEAIVLKNMIAAKVTVHDVMLDRIGTIIGSHTGPSGLIVAFWGKSRGNRTGYGTPSGSERVVRAEPDANSARPPRRR